MRLGSGLGRPPRATHIPSAVLAATQQLGHRPALTVRAGEDRQEQGFASLAGWIAKGAHLLRDEHGLGPGAALGLVGPACWPAAAVALAAWWAGITVVLDASPELVVAHTALSDTPHAPGPDREVLWFGDELDGTGSAPTADGEQWTDAVTPHGDRPPPPAHDGSLVAFAGTGGAEVTQRELLAVVAEEPAGVLGLWRSGCEDLLAGPDAATVLAALALRPLVTGAATVVVLDDDPERDAHALAERVTRWVR
jgi:uncharacterized protein (TIGR03089 family)